ncbi:MAG TPA: Nif3-like dinuclear metal center hexameric protein [Candidatus Thioglobus sp.]|jgi:dinuclear metal center YbgI/SA1388 family protein|nr:Nif3-like dinuclear metal center hexameric protein [Candidatus Thioglobus sp.]HIL42580.1 Nif3-like dinuclear metal center hexameric protein [Gammaproteobacteria bacterium]
MVDNKTLSKYCSDYLKVDQFNDYSPNGLQIEGCRNISKIIAGVSANIDLIEKAIEQKADALFVHHGFFWKNEEPSIIGIKRNRIALIIEHNINLFGYHLPLDAHPVVGNNAQLAEVLNIENPEPISDTLVWTGHVNSTLQDLSELVDSKLDRKPLVIGEKSSQIRKVAWCTGAAQDMIEVAIDIGADVFITGEVSEKIPAIAKENKIAFISAGHHATERYGVQALCRHLSDKFELEYSFIDIDNTV